MNAELPSLGARLGNALAARAPTGDRPLLAATVQLLLDERANGHVCLALAEYAGTRAPDGALFPPVEPWTAALHATGVCSAATDDLADAPSPALPLVLDGAARLYLRRDHLAERTLATFVRDRLRIPDPADGTNLRAELAALWPEAADRERPDWQRIAVAAAVRHSFCVLTGGPGTGKTTTIGWLLAVLLQRQPDLRIALAAPTGKAASRLHEALLARAAAIPALRPVADRVRPTTLHRLLGYVPSRDTFWRGPGSPLPCDVVVVDEASMADPTLLARLCSALPERARLVLAGDRDQLAAVAAGQALGDICRAAAPSGGVSRSFADFVHAATGDELPVSDRATPLADAIVALRTSHRFGAGAGIGAFTQALARREAAAALAVMQGGHADLQVEPEPTRAFAAFAKAVLAALRSQRPADAIRLGRILCAVRHGPHGALAWNARVEALLQQHGVRTADPWYPGRQVLVTANDHANNVWNGDLGVVVVDAEGKTQVAFPLGDGSVRHIAPRRLPAHETAWAMTIHKAQGSEFDHVLVAMPDQPGPWWQAPLLYTGVTRARQRAIVCADPGQLGPALAHWPTRSSGLADALARI
jgi:exodeoxyribonuclease V alpha subunit